MSIAVDYEKATRQRARLAILEELDKQTSESLSTPFFEEPLALCAIYQDWPWINQEIEYLRNMGAVTVIECGDEVKIASLTDHGKRHLNRHIAIEGVQRPRRAGG